MFIQWLQSVDCVKIIGRPSVQQESTTVLSFFLPLDWDCEVQREINLARSKLQRENPLASKQSTLILLYRENGVDFSPELHAFRILVVTRGEGSAGVTHRFLADARLCFDGPNFRSRRQHTRIYASSNSIPSFFPTFFETWQYELISSNSYRNEPIWR